MTEQQLIDAAKAPSIAYNQKDWGAVRNAVAPDFVYDEVAHQLRAEGIDDVLEVWRGWAEAMPDSEGTIEGTYVAGNDVVLEITWRGSQTGPLQTPEGAIPPTGKQIEVRACQIVHVENGKATSMRQYFDMQTVLTQLGIVSGAASGAATG